jgi:MFS family permease
MTFRRDRVTVLAYAALAAFALCLYGLGPQLAFLRDELRLSYSLTSLHSVLWATGTIVIGFVLGFGARRLGRRRLFWYSAAGTAAGTLLFSVSHVLALTLASAAILGLAGTALQSATTVVLSDRHGPLRDRALVEANIFASGAALCAPLLLGLLAQTPAGWRAELVIPAIALGATYLVLGRVQLPTLGAARTQQRSPARLPALFWLNGLLLSAVAGVEFSVVFFGAGLVHATTGVGVAVAASLLSLFYGGELMGRLAGTGLTRSPGRGPVIIAFALVVAAAGFVALWTSQSLPVAALGFFVIGLGVANLYPLSLALALATAPENAEAATARTQILVGGAVISAPFALAAMADQVGIRTAFSLVLALIVLAAILLIVSRIYARGVRSGSTDRGGGVR